MHIKTLFFPLLFFYGTAICDASVSNDKCGFGYDTYEGTVKESPFKKPICTTSAQKSFKKPEVIRIKNLKHLIKQLNIPKNRQFFNNYFIKKIFDNSHINSYTLTYMIYQDITVFKTEILNDKTDRNITATDFIKRYGDSYIKEVKSGGEHILLFHIITDSSLDYRKAKKILNDSLRSIENFKKKLYSLSKKHQIVIKEYFTKSLGFIPSDEIAHSFSSLENFTKEIIKNNLPYKYTPVKYFDLNTTSIDEKKKKLTENIERFLSLKYALNNYNYYRHNPELFLHPDKNSSKTLRIAFTKANNLLRDIRQDRFSPKEINITATNIKLPPRYKASALKQTIAIEPQISAIYSQEQISRTMPDKKIKIDLQSKLDIKNHGQLLRIQNTISYKLDNQKYTKTHTNLLFDTYVNFNGLRFKSILNNYGTLSLSLTFDKYKQYTKVEGAGIIDNATCGYEITTDNILKILCKDIRYKPIKIEFTHEEDL